MPLSPVKNREDFYLTLNIPSTASTDEIKKAYYQLAKKFHPDKNSDPECSERFKIIVEAYQILSDQKKRREYDRTRKPSKPNLSSFSRFSEQVRKDSKTKASTFTDGYWNSFYNNRGNGNSSTRPPWDEDPDFPKPQFKSGKAPQYKGYHRKFSDDTFFPYDSNYGSKSDKKFNESTSDSSSKSKTKSKSKSKSKTSPKSAYSQFNTHNSTSSSSNKPFVSSTKNTEDWTNSNTAYAYRSSEKIYPGKIPNIKVPDQQNESPSSTNENSSSSSPNNYDQENGNQNGNHYNKNDQKHRPNSFQSFFSFSSSSSSSPPKNNDNKKKEKNYSKQKEKDIDEMKDKEDDDKKTPKKKEKSTESKFKYRRDRVFISPKGYHSKMNSSSETSNNNNSPGQNSSKSSLKNDDNNDINNEDFSSIFANINFDKLSPKVPKVVPTNSKSKNPSPSSINNKFNTPTSSTFNFSSPDSPSRKNQNQNQNPYNNNSKNHNNNLNKSAKSSTDKFQFSSPLFKPPLQTEASFESQINQNLNQNLNQQTNRPIFNHSHSEGDKLNPNLNSTKTKHKSKDTTSYESFKSALDVDIDIDIDIKGFNINEDNNINEHINNDDDYEDIIDDDDFPISLDPKNSHTSSNFQQNNGSPILSPTKESFNNNSNKNNVFSTSPLNPASTNYKNESFDNLNLNYNNLDPKVNKSPTNSGFSSALNSNSTSNAGTTTPKKTNNGGNDSKRKGPIIESDQEIEEDISMNDPSPLNRNNNVENNNNNNNENETEVKSPSWFQDTESFTQAINNLMSPTRNDINIKTSNFFNSNSNQTPEKKMNQTNTNDNEVENDLNSPLSNRPNLNFSSPSGIKGSNITPLFKPFLNSTTTTGGAVPRRSMSAKRRGSVNQRRVNSNNTNIGNGSPSPSRVSSSYISPSKASSREKEINGSIFGDDDDDDDKYGIGGSKLRAEFTFSSPPIVNKTFDINDSKSKEKNDKDDRKNINIEIPSFSDLKNVPPFTETTGNFDMKDIFNSMADTLSSPTDDSPLKSSDINVEPIKTSPKTDYGYKNENISEAFKTTGNMFETTFTPVNRPLPRVNVPKPIVIPKRSDTKNNVNNNPINSPFINNNKTPSTSIPSSSIFNDQTPVSFNTSGSQRTTLKSLNVDTTIFSLIAPTPPNLPISVFKTKEEFWLSFNLYMSSMENYMSNWFNYQQQLIQYLTNRSSRDVLEVMHYMNPQTNNINGNDDSLQVYIEAIKLDLQVKVLWNKATETHLNVLKDYERMLKLKDDVVNG